MNMVFSLSDYDIGFVSIKTGLKIMMDYCTLFHKRSFSEIVIVKEVVEAGFFAVRFFVQYFS